MGKLWIERDEVHNRLRAFFSENKGDIQDFGSTVNQTFEAFVFASLVNWYKNHGWLIEFKHPKTGSNVVKLKFSTRGRPSSYTYVLCTKGDQKVQIRHGLRVSTRYNRTGLTHPANVVLDVAVISNLDLSKHKTDDHIENSHLVTFGEAKHMSAFAELIANFIGLVHELMPNRIREIRVSNRRAVKRRHPAPFLYVSGYLLPTAQGIAETIKDRGYDIDIYDYITGAKMFDVKLPVKYVRKSTKTKRPASRAPQATF